MAEIPAPQAPACIVTIRDTPVRLYAHPSVEHGRPWCALADVAGLVGYPQEYRQAVAEGWRRAHPAMVGVAGDGAVIVSDAVVLGFLQWLETIGLETTVRAAYKLEAGRAYLEMTAAVPYDVWRDAAQRSALADAARSGGAAN